MDCTASVATTQLSHYGWKESTDTTSRTGQSCFPIKHYLQKHAVDQFWPMAHGFLTLILEYFQKRSLCGKSSEALTCENFFSGI